MSKELLIKGGYVVTVDPDLGDLPSGDVLVTDGLITAVGPDLAPATTGAEVIEAAGRLVIPGLVDTHRHVWQGAIGGYTPQITGAGYGPAVLTGIALKHSPQDVYAGTLWGALQALDAGITTIADWAHNNQSAAHADADLRGLRDSGIRGYFLYGGPGPATGDPNPPHPADAGRMRDQYFASGTYGRLRMGMALRGPCFTSAERNAQDYAFARDLGLPISVHVGMAGTADAVTTLQRYRLLGADVNYVHGNMLTDREFDLIAETQGTVTITPSTDMLMQFGTFPATGPALSRGIVSGFGIDTICSAGNDLFSEMRLALAAERSRANAPALASGKQVPAVDLHQRDMLRLATIDGARVWHLEDEIGTLTPGKQADIVVIDMRSPHLDGFGDPVAVMVLGAGPADVETVIVGGDVVKRDGRLAGDNAGHALDLMHAARAHLTETNDRDQPKGTAPMSRVLITGSTEGLGLMAARLLAGDGHSVTLHARSAARAQDARAALPAARAVVTGDLSSIAGMRQVAEQANADGPYDAVIHNAGVGYREPRRIRTDDGLAHIFAVNVLAPYLLTGLIERPGRLVYLSSGMHRGGDPGLADPQWEHRRWNGSQAYADSKLFDVVLAFAVARLWTGVLSNALEPGWVPTRMGGPGAPDDMSLAPVTQAWLAVSSDPDAEVTGGYFYHRKPRMAHPAARDPKLQDQLLSYCAELTGVTL